jgi:DNA invertase Pin-like site-specific DNA recombinase
VSTDKQADHGISLDAQRAKIEAYASLYDLDLVEIIVDAGASAKTLDRPGLQSALAMLKAGKAEALLVVKLDRLTRSVADLGTLVEKYFQKAALLSVSDQIDTRSASGRLVLNVLASVAQWEREAIGERTRAALQYMKSQGKRTGHIPFGSRLAADGIHLEQDPTEQSILTTISTLQKQGLPLRKIADELNSRGLQNRGNPWNHVAVARVSKNVA